jgi:hypothetical protein
MQPLEFIAGHAIAFGVEVDRAPGDRSAVHAQLAIGRQVAERVPLELQMIERVDPRLDAGQIGQRKPGRGRGIGDGLERLAPIELPDQGVGQFFASMTSGALRRCATTEPA